MTPMIPTYFSHSYRIGDRALNETFLQYFWKHGFAFTVDPKSDTPTMPHLEVMMQRSAAFVAVAPLREGVPRYRTSPFIVHECGLAEQANRPSLLFIETGVAGAAFDSEDLITFDRRDVVATLDRQIRRIEELYERSRPDHAMALRPLGSVGLWLPRSRPYRSVVPLIREVLENAGYRPEIVRTDYEDPWRLLTELRQHDFVVTDVGAAGANAGGPFGPPLPLTYAGFIPAVKLVHEPNGRPGGAPPRLATSRALRDAGAEADATLRWSAPADLVGRLAGQVAKLASSRLQFRSAEEGLKYVRSLGRPEGGRVFLSNAGADNEIASRIVRMLGLYNIDPFHYVYNNSLQRGAEYAEPLRRLVTSSSLFVPLISESYWESQWCREEFELADRMREAGRLTIMPYFLDSVGAHGVSIQGETVAGLDAEDQVSTIVTGVDALLTSPPETVLGPRPGPTVASQRGRVDIAIVTVLPEEYAAVRDRLDAPLTVAGDDEMPNRYAWDVGSVDSRHSVPYRVVVALAGRPGTRSGLMAVDDTVRAFEPRYVLLVGVAGGLGDVGLGDVVVSDTIVGYEFGKIVDGRLEPRTNWTYTTDTAILNAAVALPSRFPDWHEPLRGLHGRTAPPRIVVGTVASGNKVVDDVRAEAFAPVADVWPKLVAVEMEGLGAAEAVERLGQLRRSPVNFAMVRGISDLPVGSLAAGTGPTTPSSQTKQRDSSKALAAAAAAEFVVHLLGHTWPEPPLTGTPPA